MDQCVQCSRLTGENIPKINCAPGGLEFRGAELRGDLDGVLAWHRDMMDQGMTGFSFARGGEVRGFAQYMPEESAPVPIIAPEAAVLMCFHWNISPGQGEEEHLGRERTMLQRVIDDARGCREYTGMAAVGWDHPSHFPIPLLENLGFRSLHREGEMALMWLPFAGGCAEPRVAEQSFHPLDLSGAGRLAVQLAWSHRCPYDVHHRMRIRRIIEEMDPGRIRYDEILTDTREQVLAHRAPSWNWQWLYVNGEELAAFRLTAEQLRGRLAGV